MRKILIIAALCLCATPAAAQEPTPTQKPAQPAAQDAKQAERERKEREKQEAKAAKEKAAQEAKAAKEAEAKAKEKAAQEAKAAKEAEAKAAKSQPTGEKVGMSSNAEQELRQLTDQSIAALKGKDTAALARIWADDLIFTTPRGDVQTKAQRLADIQSGATRFDSLETTDLAVRVYGDTAVMNGLTTVKGQYSGQEASGQYRVTQVFVRRGKVWQIVALQMTPVAPTTPAEKKP